MKIEFHDEKILMKCFVDMEISFVCVEVSRYLEKSSKGNLCIKNESKNV